jgi:hypothetical protein
MNGIVALKSTRENGCHWFCHNQLLAVTFLGRPGSIWSVYVDGYHKNEDLSNKIVLLLEVSDRS